MKYQDNQHFSHHHILKSLVLGESEELQCQACEKPIFDHFHGCISCNFYLHDNCLNAPRSLVHPSHPSHPLTLLPTPTYSSRSFTCNACGSEGRSCSLSCAHCEFDLHVQCALLPKTVLLAQHHHHELKLTFDCSVADEDESTIFVCDLCHGETDHNYWFYYCADCDFGTHIECSISKYVNKAKENAVMNTKPKEEPVISRPKKNPVRKTEKKSTKNPKMKPVTESSDGKPAHELPQENEEREENVVIMKPKLDEPINKEITEQLINTPTKGPVRKTVKKSAKNLTENPKIKTVSLDKKPADKSPEENEEREQNAENMKVPTNERVISTPTKSPIRKTKKKSAKNPGENPKSKPVSESAPDKLPEENEGGEEEKSSELTYYDAQRRLKEQHMKNMTMLQALDNAASYVGPSRGYYYY